MDDQIITTKPVGTSALIGGCLDGPVVAQHIDVPVDADPRIGNSSASIRHLNQIELSRRWSVSPRTLERWRWLGRGPRYLKIVGRVVYRLDDIEVFEAHQARAAAQVRPLPARKQATTQNGRTGENLGGGR